VLAPDSDDALIDALQSGPVAVAVVASTPCFATYASGIMTNDDCPLASPLVLDHAVALVGYTTFKGLPVWVVQNSFGVGWGDGNGVAFVERGVAFPGTLGILAQASAPARVGLSAACSAPDGGPDFCAAALNATLVGAAVGGPAPTSGAVPRAVPRARASAVVAAAACVALMSVVLPS